MSIISHAIASGMATSNSSSNTSTSSTVSNPMASPMRDSPAPHKRHNLHLIPILQRRVVFFGSHQAAVQFDGDFFGSEIELRDQRAQRRAFGNVFLVAVDFEHHGEMIR